MRSKVLVPNEKYLNVKYQYSIPYGLKDIVWVEFFKTGPKFKRPKLLVKKQRSHHEVSICEISEPYLLWLKRYSQD
jgi:hypothetical protein